MKGAEGRIKPVAAWSLAARLMGWFALSTFLLLTLAVSLPYVFFMKNMEREDIQFLVDKIAVIRAILREHPEDPEAWREEVQLEGASFQYARYYARILDRAGRIFMQTPGMGERLPTAAFGAPAGPGQTRPSAIRWSSPQGARYVMMAAQAQAGSDQEPRRFIQVALDVSHEETLMRRLRWACAWGLLLGLFLSAAAGAAIARSGLRPLDDIAQAARRTSAQRLGTRLGQRPWPRELAGLAEAFDAMLDRLEESFARLSQFSSDLAHELRTPIGNLQGEAEVALSRPRSPEEYRRALESGVGECKRLTQMIERLLFLARAEDPKRRIDGLVLDARREAEAVLEFYEPLAREKGVRMDCEGEGELFADSILLRRALSNLVANALAYTPPGGRIAIRLQPLAGGGFEITVSDTGTGIASEDLPHVFDRLFRADRSRSRNPQGAGLGLPIVRSIMDLHIGTASLESTPGTGTKVSLVFPPPP